MRFKIFHALSEPRRGGLRWSPRLSVPLTLLGAAIFVCLFGWLAASSSGLAVAGAPPVVPKAPDGSTWSIVNTPNVGTGNNELHGVAAISPTDAWAVGWSGPVTASQGLVMHWDGATWSISPTVSPGSNTKIYGVSALSSNDVWAVGEYSTGAFTSSVLIQHWDGNAWTQFAGANPGTRNELLSVVAISANDVWAVGSYYDGNTYMTLAEHWNGTSWTQANTSNLNSLGQSNRTFSAVAASSGSDVWAVGGYADIVRRTLVAHWNGTTWTQVSSDSPGTNDAKNSHLYGVVVPSPGNALAVGTYGTNSGVRTLTENCSLSAPPVGHTNNCYQTFPASPNQSGDNYLLAVAATSLTDLWAVGFSGVFNSWLPLIEHAATCCGDGTAWTLSPAPSADVINYLYAVDGTGPGDVWAVGGHNDYTSATNRTLILHYGEAPVGPTSTPSATATSTSTGSVTSVPSATATSTATQTGTILPATQLPTGTANSTTAPTLTAQTTTTVTATPTACDITFPDVPPSHTFYPFITCLACRGVVTGFPDGLFHAERNITRGQISKVVSNAAGFDEDPGSQVYSDVPLGSTYYAYINRLTNRGIMSGYPCPVRPAGDECTPENPGLFKPNENATRGQLAKIVSNAAGFSEAVSGQFYADVPPTGEGSQFYEWIMRLTNRNVMGGYACGRPGEPCDAQDRPYFRWSVAVTRGQAAKIVSNTFFPGCQPPEQ